MNKSSLLVKITYILVSMSHVTCWPFKYWWSALSSKACKKIQVRPQWRSYMYVCVCVCLTLFFKLSTHMQTKQLTNCSRTKCVYVWMGLRTCVAPSANGSHTICREPKFVSFLREHKGNWVRWVSCVRIKLIYHAPSANCSRIIWFTCVLVFITAMTKNCFCVSIHTYIHTYIMLLFWHDIICLDPGYPCKFAFSECTHAYASCHLNVLPHKSTDRWVCTIVRVYGNYLFC